MRDPIVWLDHPDAGARRIGGKAASLARLAGAGFPVPPGFAVAAEAYEAFAAEHGLPALTAPLAELPSRAPLASFREALAPVAARLADAALGAETRDAIARARAELEARAGPDATFAVRSSGLNEDGAASSFAGLYESYLNLRGADAIAAATLDCYRSLWHERAVHYRAFRGIDHAGEAMAVAVMPVVRAAASGVAFTRNPLTGATDETLINASWGLGEAIVSGYVTPDSFTVGPDGELRERTVSDKRERVVPAEGGTKREPVPAEIANAPALDDAQAREAAAAARAVERLYGAPVDIEFALDEAGAFFLLQARPITA